MNRNFHASDLQPTPIRPERKHKQQFKDVLILAAHCNAVKATAEPRMLCRKFAGTNGSGQFAVRASVVTTEAT